MTALLACVTLASSYASDTGNLRPPAVPLVAVDPYFSIWSPADKLTDAETMHWTGKTHPLHLMVRVDGKPFRLMGAEPQAAPAMPQTNLEVRPLTTEYTFANAEAEFTLTFTMPFLPTDLEMMSRPVTYLNVQYKVLDNKKHDIEIYFDAGGELAVNTPEQSVVPAELKLNGSVIQNSPFSIRAMTLSCDEQNVLSKKGDDIRIDWGHFVLSVQGTTNFSARNGEMARKDFVTGGNLEKPLEATEKYRVDETNIVLAATWKMENTGGFPPIPIVLAYDDILSVRYFGDDLPAWWRKDGKTTENLVEDAWKTLNDPAFHTAVADFEQKFYADLSAVGGKDYARLCALAYRHIFAAQKIVADVNGMPLMYSKENNSNGCMGTVDLMYPHGPMLLYYSPAMMKATLQPILDYAQTSKWKFPFAPHDIGTYPHGTGQVYGGGEKSEENQMPVEESANMIILVAALAVAEDKPDYAKLHWEVLTKWAEYLLDKGFDPENQLCTDDFAGHLAHNVNLSAKAIVALGAYAQLAEKLGEPENAAKYRKAAEEFVAKWIKEADDGDHFRLAFDKPGTWSMKYNIMWDTLLDMNLFPKSVMEKELAYYKTQMKPFGLPLDNRSLYTKNDWILWTATMTTTTEDFNALVDPVVRYVNETPSRVPLSDWYFTDSARQVGFKARSVIGGYWAPMLRDTKKWQAQAAKGADVDATKRWAKILLPGKPVKTIAPTANDGKISWQFTTEKPVEGWQNVDFDDGSDGSRMGGGWQTGQAGFGRRDTPGAIVGTRWNSSDIWLRRSFEWDGEIPQGTKLQLFMHHDDNVEVYLNGELLLERAGYTATYDPVSAEQLSKLLKKGKNTLAVHCHQNHGGQYIDVGISAVEVVERQ